MKTYVVSKNGKIKVDNSPTPIFKVKFLKLEPIPLRLDLFSKGIWALKFDYNSIEHKTEEKNVRN